MTIVAESVLETASTVDFEPELVGVQSDPSDPIMLTGFVRSDRPQRALIRLRWRDATPAIADAVRLHYEAQIGAFRFRARDGLDTSATYLEPPSFQPRSATAIDITVVLEQAFDSD